ncbi:hypothetical protein ACFSTF_04375 [Terrilactibacillus laevilacticus]|uniref:Uncharacterized protein n=1 Tax=Terrilactibacillus laevilacticus TaxID=1380157 RepID=A0ABW5PNV5_9BACI
MLVALPTELSSQMNMNITYVYFLRCCFFCVPTALPSVQLDADSMKVTLVAINPK